MRPAWILMYTMLQKRAMLMPFSSTKSTLTECYCFHLTTCIILKCGILLQKRLSVYYKNTQVYNKENLNALHIIIADDDSLLPTLKEGSSAKAEMEEVEEKKGGSSCRGFSVLQCGKDADVILKEVKEAHLVMATLIAAVTFVGGLAAMPGYESEEGGGQASLARNAALIVFVVTDTLALCMSACSVLMHFYLPGPDAIVLALSSTMSALIFMAIAFISGAHAALGHSPWRLVCLAAGTFGQLSSCLAVLLRKLFGGIVFHAATAA